MLDATKGGGLVGEHAGVDGDHAVFEGFGHADAAAQVAGVEVGGQAEFGVVGPADDFVLVLEAKDRCQRAEGLLAGHAHLLADAGQQRRFKEESAQGMCLAARLQGGAVGEGVVDVLADLGQRGFVDQRADLGAGVEAVADGEGGHRLGQFLHEAVVDAGLHVDAVGADAGLAGVAELGDHRTGDGGVQIGIVEDDEGGVAAQLHRHFLDGVGALGQQGAADFGGAGEGELADGVVAGQFATDGAGAAGDHVEQPGGQAGAAGQLAQGQCRQRGGRGGADDEAATGGQGRGGLAGDHRAGKVPGRDGGTHQTRCPPGPLETDLTINRPAPYPERHTTRAPSPHR